MFYVIMHAGDVLGQAFLLGLSKNDLEDDILTRTTLLVSQMQE